MKKPTNDEFPVDLAAEVDRLRAQFPETQDLYRETCALLFFRYGITPTANKLYQLVRKGSMSAPAQALAAFWQNLREKSRVRIEHPDLPPEFAQMAGEMVGALWQRARASAEASFHDAMQASRQAVADAEARAAADLARAESAAHALFQLQAEFSTTLTRLQELEHALAREQGVRETAEKQLASAVTQRRELQEALAAARRDFESQMAAQREQARDAQARHAEEAQRLVGEAEHERGLAAAAQAELAQARALALAAAQQHAGQREALVADVARLRHELGLAEGRAAELRAARDRLQLQREYAAPGGRGLPGRPRGRILGRASR